MVRVILTSNEANEAFERAFLQARSEVWAAFNYFDPDLELISPPGTRIGRSWSALIAATLRRGVHLHLFLPDADPFLAPAAHRANHASARRLQAEATALGVPNLLDIRILTHPARHGPLTYGTEWGRRRAAIAPELALLAAAEPGARLRALGDMPGLAPYLGAAADGTKMALRALAHPPLAAARHHHQLLVADRHLLLVGGPGASTDPRGYGLRLMREGPSAADAQAHLEHFAAATAGQEDPGTQRHLLRTLSRRGGRLRRGPTWPLRQDIATAHVALARRAEDLIYIETRAFTDPELAAELAAVGRARPDLGLIMMLPEAPPADPAAQAQMLAQLVRAFGPRFFAGQMMGPLCQGGQRLTLFDRRAALVTSADLTPEALYRDTEAGLYVRTPREVNEIGSRAMAYWLMPQHAAAPVGGPATVALWRARAEQQQDRGDRRMRPYPLP